jgi:hypothetical protein
VDDCVVESRRAFWCLGTGISVDMRACFGSGWKLSCIFWIEFLRVVIYPRATSSYSIKDRTCRDFDAYL